VKGHANIPENEVCDKLAFKAATEGPFIEDIGFGENENPASLFS